MILTSVFRPYNSEQPNELPFVKKDPFIESIHKAKFKNVPSNYKNLTAAEIELINKNPKASQYIPQQEKGIRPACALPYELDVDGELSADKKSFIISMVSQNVLFGERTAGCPFIIYNYSHEFKVRNYTVVAGDQLFDETLLADFENDNYNIQLHGPNGFFRSYKGNKSDPPVLIRFHYEDLSWNSIGKKPEFTGKIWMKFINPDLQNRYSIRLVDNAYNSFKPVIKDIPNVNETHTPTTITINTLSNFCWYDFSVFVEGNTIFEKRYAGHVETGKESKSDPLMGMMV